MDKSKIVEKLHDWAVLNNLKSSKAFEPFELENIVALKLAYRLFGVDDKKPNFPQILALDKKTFYRGSPVDIKQKWLNNIMNSEFGAQYQLSGNTIVNSPIFKQNYQKKPMSAIARHGLGYCFADSLDYIKLIVEKLYEKEGHKKLFLPCQQVVAMQLCEDAKIIDDKNLKLQLEEHFPTSIPATKDINIHSKNSSDEKAAIVGKLLKANYTQSLAALALGYDGFYIERRRGNNPTELTNEDLDFTEIVITNRNVLILFDMQTKN